MKPKHVPRLWCALQGLLPFDACLAAQRGELAWPGSSEVPAAHASAAKPNPENRGNEAKGARSRR